MDEEPTLAVGPDLDRTALVIADRRGRVAYWSPGATALFGYAAEAMVGKAVSILVPPAFRRRHTAGFRAAWATGVFEPSGAVMIPVVYAHGELLAVCATWSPPHQRDGALRLLD
jgi:PAS domain S-box-containing protein